MSTDHGTGFEQPSGAAAAEAGSGRSAAPAQGAAVRPLWLRRERDWSPPQPAMPPMGR